MHTHCKNTYIKCLHTNQELWHLPTPWIPDLPECRLSQKFLHDVPSFPVFYRHSHAEWPFERGTDLHASDPSAAYVVDHPHALFLSFPVHTLGRPSFICTRSFQCESVLNFLITLLVPCVISVEEQPTLWESVFVSVFPCLPPLLNKKAQQPQIKGEETTEDRKINKIKRMEGRNCFRGLRWKRM